MPRHLGLLSIARGAGFSILLLLTLMTLWPGLFAGSDPLQTQPEARLQGPSREHIFGTDYLGRDIFARVVYGARISLVPALIVVLLSAMVGSLLGLVAGYVGGVTDEIVMRVTDVFLAIPALILAIAIATALGPTILHAAIAVVVVWWPGFARLARSEAQVLRTLEYVSAAQASGAGRPRILLVHVLPNMLASLIVKMSLDAGTVLLLLAALSFLGLGPQAPSPEWGLEVGTTRLYMFDSPWYTFSSGIAIFLAVYSLNLVGDSIRERLDPRLRV
ncbi:MAG TPA: ABC transporter permease [Candidatus Methylomirabilis sp.]|nr:ABC transporter permease [Candidatus Methylomirabilis sp.]